MLGIVVMVTMELYKQLDTLKYDIFLPRTFLQTKLICICKQLENILATEYNPI